MALCTLSERPAARLVTLFSAWAWRLPASPTNCVSSRANAPALDSGGRLTAPAVPVAAADDTEATFMRLPLANVILPGCAADCTIARSFAGKTAWSGDWLRRLDWP